MFERLPEGVRLSLPLILPTAAVGVSIGLLAAPLLGPFPAIAMSALVWAGSAQFAALGVLSGGAGVWLAIVTGMIANGRFLPMGFALAPSTPGGPLRRLATGAAMVDASYALAHRGGGRFDPAIIVWSMPAQYVAWVGGTALGVAGAGVLGDPDRFGLDVLFPVFFLGLLLPELWPARFGRHGGDGIGGAEPESPPPPRTARRPLVVAGLAAVIVLVLTPFTPTGVPVLVAAAAALVGLRPVR